MFGHDPQNTGHTKSVTGPKGDIGIAWQFTGGTPTMNCSPVIVDGTVYTGATGDPGGLFAVDATSGEKLWSFETDGYVSSAPAVLDGTLYAGTWGQTFYAIDIADGTRQWAVEYPKEHRFSQSSPVVVDGTVYVGTIGDAPLVVSGPEDEEQFSRPALLALDADTGEERWRYDDFGPRQEVSSSPAVADGRVYIGGDNDANAVYALDADSGDVVWERSLPTHPESSPAVANDLVYYGAPHDGGPTPCRLWALDGSTGETVWTHDVDDQSLRTSPAVADGTVYVSASSMRVCLAGGGGGQGEDDDCSGVTRGRLYAINAETGEEEWLARTATDTRSSPAVADGIVYVGARSGIFAVTTDGEREWHIDFSTVSAEDDPYVKSSPAVGEGGAYIGCSDGNLYAIGER